jgi:hypothetical protein
MAIRRCRVLSSNRHYGPLSLGCPRFLTFLSLAERLPSITLWLAGDAGPDDGWPVRFVLGGLVLQKDRLVGGDPKVALASVSPLARSQRSATRKFSRFHSIWPVALLISVVLVTVAWIGFLGFAFFELIDSALL